jgi:hypothetical protein
MHDSSLESCASQRQDAVGWMGMVACQMPACARANMQETAAGFAWHGHAFVPALRVAASIAFPEQQHVVGAA